MKFRCNVIILLLIILIIQLAFISAQLSELQNIKKKVVNNVEYTYVSTEVCKETSNIEDKENEIKTEEVWLKNTNGSHIKPYMDYNMITDKSSKQYKFIHRDDVKEDDRGFLMQDEEWYCVALGSYFGKIGSKYIITLDNGNEVKVVKSEAKSDKHTDEDNYLSFGGHIVEFLINTDSCWMHDNDIIYNGSLNVYDKLEGSIVSIEKVVS